jgi:hypothetical protein
MMPFTGTWRPPHDPKLEPAVAVAGTVTATKRSFDLIDTQPERTGSLGAYIRFRAGKILSTTVDDARGIVLYHDAIGGHGNLVALELQPGSEHKYINDGGGQKGRRVLAAPAVRSLLLESMTETQFDILWAALGCLRRPEGATDGI